MGGGRTDGVPQRFHCHSWCAHVVDPLLNRTLPVARRNGKRRVRKRNIRPLLRARATPQHPQCVTLELLRDGDACVHCVEDAGTMLMPITMGVWEELCVGLPMLRYLVFGHAGMQHALRPRALLDLGFTFSEFSMVKHIVLTQKVSPGCRWTPSWALAVVHNFDKLGGYTSMSDILFEFEREYMCSFEAKQKAGME